MTVFTPRAADPNRPLPAHPGERVDQAHAALAALREEQRRLERLGLEEPLARCHQQMRFWQFVVGVVSMPDDSRSSAPWGTR